MKKRLDILLLGGYGIFGKRLTINLAAHTDHRITIVGRSKNRAKQLQLYVEREYKRRIEFKVMDVLSDDFYTHLMAINPDVVVNAAGPYIFIQGENNFQVANACIQLGCHYIDLADNRQFVSNISSLDKKAKDEKLMIVSGASTVPGLSSAVVDNFLEQFSQLESIEYGISPGNRIERGAATVGSILSYAGRPFKTLLNGRSENVYGWQQLSRYNFGSPLGKRWMSHCDIPDLELFPARYPTLKTVNFKAGLEVSVLHVGLWLVACLVRLGIVKDLPNYANLLTRMSHWFIRLGSDDGGMFMILKGDDIKGEKQTIQWDLVAQNGVGPNIPTIAAELLIHRIAGGDISYGAQACMSLFSLEEFMLVAKRWSIYQTVSMQSH